ncbi:MAG TPA: hypothetical protein VMY88_05670 [Acidimicrobiales bacterium]|nr:hypothetical protein [Acidimicrobiales bacterium]
MTGRRSVLGSPDGFAKPAAGAAWCVLLGWFFVSGRQVPLLSLVDLGFHELGHLLTYPLPWELVTAAMGSVTQVAVPLGLAGYFLFLRGEPVSAGVCLAWTATSAWGVHAYIADAPNEQLPLIGGDHDWAFILHELDQMGAAANLARVVWLFGLICLAAGLALCLVEGPWLGRGEIPSPSL